MSRHTVTEETIVTNPTSDRTVLGFWVYLMTDCLLFASLFATFMVLRTSTFGGPSGRELFSPNFILIETMLLLTSSFTCGLALLAGRRQQRTQLLVLLALTFALGCAFLGMELTEFRHLAHEGNSWQRSAFLSAFFTLVGTHGAHITAGLLWLLALVPRFVRGPLSTSTLKRLTMFSLFWHFLDIVWIFIFTIVYLLGVAS